MKRPPNFPALLESFFMQRLMAQRQATHTLSLRIGTPSACC